MGSSKQLDKKRGERGGECDKARCDREAEQRSSQDSRSMMLSTIDESPTSPRCCSKEESKVTRVICRTTPRSFHALFRMCVCVRVRARSSLPQMSSHNR